ncbi:LCP family protein [Mediterraneibacter glycyrrhizinilyticus]|uniref:LCP family protein n=1 Tax=Mediterraneibacter glycyrrhizinilyticus TaxID=342942 RepID=UPI001D08B999|nr:LCP family protein [Mediterraneibacter glycyrrhizinilyticus]MCB6309298.1 LCP family protein [Lachnospiraceae bacterium 210521-DFI.1.109]MCB6427205.1 LCP family protein [Mediterraneibacter glycyrrhizinilyticus]
MAEKRKNVRNTRPAGSGERTRKTGNGGSPKSRSSAKQSGTRQGGAKSAGSTKQPARSAQDKKAQAQRKRRMEEQRQRVAYENPAKSVIGSGKKNGYPGNKKGHGKRDNQISWTIGVVLGVIQAVASVVFMIALFVLDMLPVKYLAIIAGLLLIALLIVFTSQLLSKKKGIAGKIFSVLMSVILAVGSFYIFKANGTVSEISGSGTKVDKVVVAVLADDPAESIQDAKDYSFGVQYALKGEEIQETVGAINEELGSAIAETEYRSVQEQATALHNGDVQAIIYNEAYNGILSEEFGDFGNSIKVIYSHSIETKVENNAAEQVEVKDDTFTVYISGIDVYGAIETNSRSDVNIMAVVNPTSHQILLVTTPRDYYVEIPGISGGELDKLTHAGIYGVDASMATLGQLYDTTIDFYARVNFTSLVEMVDALGGVDVYSEQAFTTSEDTGLVMNVVQGENHFNGQQALAFSRERMNVDGGDFQRGKNQQAVITAMIKKAVSPAILVGANGILNSVSGNVDTNMSQDQIQTLIKTQLSDGGVWNIKSVAAEGTGDQQYCFSSPGSLLYVTQPDPNSVASIKAMIDSVENGEVFTDSEVVQ